MDIKQALLNMLIGSPPGLHPSAPQQPIIRTPTMLEGLKLDMPPALADLIDNLGSMAGKFGPTLGDVAPAGLSTAIGPLASLGSEGGGAAKDAIKLVIPRLEASRDWASEIESIKKIVKKIYPGVKFNNVSDKMYEHLEIYTPPDVVAKVKSTLSGKKYGWSVLEPHETGRLGKDRYGYYLEDK